MSESRMAWTDAGNVLAIRLDNLGDVLMTTPALRAIKASPARPRLTLLASTPGAAIASLVPEVDDVVVYDAPWVKNDRDPAPASVLACATRLASARFDAAVIFTVYTQSALPAAMLAWLAGIPLRLAHCRENPYHLLSDWIVEPEPQHEVRHEVKRQLDLVGKVGFATADDSLSLAFTERDDELARRKLQRAGIDLRRPYVVLHPGASAASRRYPPEHYAVVARRLALHAGHQVLVTGGEGDGELVAAVCAGARDTAVPLCGELGLAELAAAIRRAALLIANNSGPVHVAAAVGTPVVDLYALTNPQHTPWRVPSRVLFHDVPCKYCYKSSCPRGHHDCLRRVPPGAVVQAARELLESAAQRPEDAGAPGRRRPLADPGVAARA